MEREREKDGGVFHMQSWNPGSHHSKTLVGIETHLEAGWLFWGQEEKGCIKILGRSSQPI